MIRSVDLAGWRRRIFWFVAGGAFLTFLATAWPRPLLAQNEAAQDPATARSSSDDDEWDAPLGDDRETRTKLGNYRALVSKGVITGESDRTLIADVVRWKLARLTHKSNREPPPPKDDPKRKDWMPLHEIREDILKDTRQAGSLGGGKDVRPELLKTIVKEIPAILEGYHFAARLNGAILLSELNASDNPEQPYVPAYQLLNKLARDTSQADPVRIWGVMGCRRLLMYDQTPAEVRAALVKSLTELLREQNKASKAEKARHDWLNFRIVESLGWSRTILVDRRPEVVDALAQVIIDTDHPWRPRYYAAQSVGRLPMDGSINLSMISVEIVRLGQQIALEYKETPDEPRWKIAAWRIYFAFRPETDVDKAAQSGLKTQVDTKSALGSLKKPVNDAYDVLVPILSDILNSKKELKVADLDKLNKWLLDNTPKDFKVHPNLNPLTLPPNHAKVAQGGSLPEQ